MATLEFHPLEALEFYLLKSHSKWTHKSATNVLDIFQAQQLAGFFLVSENFL